MLLGVTRIILTSRLSSVSSEVLFTWSTAIYSTDVELTTQRNALLVIVFTIYEVLNYEFYYSKMFCEVNNNDNMLIQIFSFI